MSAVAFTFGAFGDIVSLLQLAWSLRSMLASVAGASKEIKVIVEDIDTLTAVLQQAKSTLDHQNIPPPTERALKHALQSCCTILRQAQVKAQSFNAKIVGLKRPDRNGLQNILEDFWARIGWNVFGGHSEVEGLRRRLLEQINVIQLLLSTLQTGAHRRVEDKSDQIISKVESLERMPMVVEHILNAVNDLPTRLSYGTCFYFISERENSATLPVASLIEEDIGTFLSQVLSTFSDSQIDLSSMLPQAGRFVSLRTYGLGCKGRIIGRRTLLQCFFDPGSAYRKPVLLISGLEWSYGILSGLGWTSVE